MTWTITSTNLLPDDADAVAYIAADLINAFGAAIS